jgi:hypothetical protein
MFLLQVTFLAAFTICLALSANGIKSIDKNNRAHTNPLRALLEEEEEEIIFGFVDDAEFKDLPPGYKCQKKIVMVQDWTSDEELQCRHVNQTSCFQIMTTKYKTIRV